MISIVSRGASIALGAAFLVAFAGCAGAPPRLHTYELRAPLANAAKPAPGAARVAAFTGAGSGARHELARRVSEHEIEFLDYHRYLDRPADVLTQALIDAVGSRTGPRDGDAEGSPLALGGSLNAFEIDWRDATKPRARVEIAADLDDGMATSSVAVEENEPVASDASPEQCVAALEVALGRAVGRVAKATSEAAERRAAAEPAPKKPALTPAAVPPEVEFDLAVDVAAATDPSPSHALLVRRAVAMPPLDRRPVIARNADARLTELSGLRFARLPAEIVTDAVLDALLQARPDGKGVARAESAEPDGASEFLEIATTLRRFEVDLSAATPAAVVSLEMTSGRKTVVATGSFEAPEINRHGAGMIADTRALAAAFSAAASRAIDIALRGIAQPAAPAPAVARADAPPARLSISADLPAPLAGPLPGSARLVAVTAPIELDVSDVMLRGSKGRVGRRDDVEWAITPSIVVQDHLLAALRSARVFDGGVVGSRGPGVHEHEVHGELRAFEVDERPDGPVARVVIELEAVQRSAATSRVALAQGVAEAKLEGGSPDDIAAAMGRALGQAAGAAVRQLKDKIREATPDSSK